MKRMEKEERRMVTFSNRCQGLFKKAHQLHSKTSADITVLVSSPAGRPYIHGDPSFDATVDRYLSAVQEPNGSETNKLSLWLEFFQVEAYDRVDDQLALKKELEDISGMLDQLVKPFLV